MDIFLLYLLMQADTISAVQSETGKKILNLIEKSIEDAVTPKK
jgi:hypothetical protein